MYIFRFVDFFPLSIVKMTIIPRTLLFEFEKKLIHRQLVFSLKLSFFLMTNMVVFFLEKCWIWIRQNNVDPTPLIFSTLLLTF